MLDKSVIREGVLLYKGGEVFIDGWEIGDDVMCREVVALACLYTARVLMERGLALIQKPGGDGLTCSDMPSETPVAWLCDETRRFLDPDYEPAEAHAESRNVVTR